MRTLGACTAALLALPMIAQGWTDRSALGGPPPRFDHAMCYDAAHGYVILFGGIRTPPGNASSYSDTWTWDGVVWTQRSPSNVPSAGACAMTYHATTPETLLATSTGQTYAWDGGNWVSRGAIPSGNPVRMAYDPQRGETIAISQSTPGAVAVWNGNNWTTRQALVVPNIYTSYEFNLATDPGTNRIVMTGMGSYPNQPVYWEWTGISWQQRVPALPGTVWQLPFYGAMASDTVHRRMVMFDIQVFWPPVQPNHTWTIADGVVTQLTTPLQPSLRSHAAMTFDSGRGRVVLFGGDNGFQAGMGDTWEFDLGDGPSYSTFGGGCLGSTGHPAISAQGTSLPRIGQTFSLQVNNLPFTGLVFLWLGLSDQSYLGHALPFDLSVIGAPNCNVLCSGDQLLILPNVLGTSVWNFTVPPFPGAVFFNQVFALDPGINALGLTTSNGGRGVIGM